MLVHPGAVEEIDTTAHLAIILEEEADTLVGILDHSVVPELDVFDLVALVLGAPSKRVAVAIAVELAIEDQQRIVGGAVGVGIEPRPVVTLPFGARIRCGQPVVQPSRYGVEPAQAAAQAIGQDFFGQARLVRQEIDACQLSATPVLGHSTQIESELRPFLQRVVTQA